jgi:hemoglobin/transferrin/lactoferrin receptor protein
MLAVWRAPRNRRALHYTRRMDPFLARVPLLLATAALACPATAQDLAGLETVTVVGKRPEPLREAAAAVSVITADEIEAAVAFDMRDALTGEPAVSVARDPLRFGDVGVTVRGLGGNRVLVETDGVPAAESFAVGSFSNAGRGFADLELVKRIELLRGPASALYGSDAIAGVLATTTLDPVDLLGPDLDAFLRARAGYASDDDSLLAGLTGALRSGPLEGMLAFAHRESGEREHGGGPPPPNPADRESDALLGRLVLPHAGDLRLSAQWNRERIETDIDALELSGGRFANTTRLAGDDRMETRGFLVDQALAPAGGFDGLQWRAYWSETAVRQLTHEERRAAPPVLPPLAIEREFRYDQRVAGGELSVARDFAAASGPHRLLGGIELSESEVSERRNGLQTDLETGESTATILGESLPVRDFPISRIREAGLYLQDEWRPGGGDWSLIPALRFDGYWLDPRVDAMYADDNPSEPPVSVSESAASPKLGIARRFGDGTTAYLQYAHGFRAPPFDDVNIGLDIPQFNVRAIPNPDLKSERSDSLELGLRFWGGRLSGSASVYAGWYDDFIESRVNIGPDPETGTILFQSRNIARAQIAGVEATFESDLGAWRAALAGFTARLSAGWTEGEDTVRDEPINSIDPPRGTLGLRYDAPSAAWSAGIDVMLVGAKGDVDDSAGPLFRPGSYSVVDLRLQWRPNTRFTASLGLFNLADRSYYDWAAVRGLGPEDPLLPLYREPGRNLAVTVTAALD